MSRDVPDGLPRDAVGRAYRKRLARAAQRAEKNAKKAERGCAVTVGVGLSLALAVARWRGVA